MSNVILAIKDYVTVNFVIYDNSTINLGTSIVILMTVTIFNCQFSDINLRHLLFNIENKF